MMQKMIKDVQLLDLKTFDEFFENMPNVEIDAFIKENILDFYKSEMYQLSKYFSFYIWT